MKEKLEQIRNMAKQKAEEIKNMQELNDLKVKMLGKKGELTEILRGMKDLSPEERPVIGSLVNKVRDDIEENFKKVEEIIKISHDKINRLQERLEIAKNI